MSDENLNEKANENNELENAELITDSPSSALEKVEEKNDGPKRRKKPAKKPKEDKIEEDIDMSNDEKVEKVVEEIIEEEEAVEVEKVVEEKEEKVEAVKEEKPAKKEDKKEEVKTVHQNEESKAPKTMKQRYVDMLTGKNFEVRLRGNRVYDSSSKLKFELTDTGVKINNKDYKYSEVVIRIK